MADSQPPRPRKHGIGHRIFSGVGMTVWGALYFITLGFSHKYRQRLRSFERLDPHFAVEDSTTESSVIRKQYKAHTQPPTYFGLPYKLASFKEGSRTSQLVFERVKLECDESLRARQREEWEKLSTTASVITATSAAALAIPDLAGARAYWMVNTCFCAALGVSLEGLILVFYINIMASGTSDETIGRLARGKIQLLGSFEISARLPALIMALPVVFATYSSLFLLIGCVAMVIAGPNYSQESVPNPYYYLPLVPIGFGFLCGCSAVLVCEVATYREEQLRREYKDYWATVKKKLVEQALPVEKKIRAATVIDIWSTYKGQREDSELPGQMAEENSRGEAV